MVEPSAIGSGDVTGFADLAAAVLSQEAERRARRVTEPTTGAASDAGLLVGADAPVSLRDALRREGRALLANAGGLWFFAIFEFAVLAVLAPDLRAQFELGDRFLANVVMAPALLFLIAQAIGNLVDRPGTSRPRVMGAMAGLGACALAAAAITGNRWVFLAMCATAGLGLLASMPAQVSMLADRYPLGARVEILAGYTAIGMVAFVVGPLVAGLGSAAAAHHRGEWRVGFLGAALAVALIAWRSSRLPDVRRGRGEVRALFGDERALVAEQPSSAHVLARFAQIQTLRFLGVGVVALGFALLGWGLWINLHLAHRFGLGTTDRALLLAIVAVPGVCMTPLVGTRAGRRFRSKPGSALTLAAVLLAAFNASVLGLWMPNVVLLALCEAIGFAGACGALATVQPVAQAVIPPQMRGQAGAVFMNLLFVGASAGAATMVALTSEYGFRSALSVAVPLLTTTGAGLMVFAGRFVEPDIGRIIEELREERATTDLIAAGAEPPVLQIRDLDFSYGELQVLFGINLDVRRGETVALLGTNGAGKSTLLRVVSGLAVPSRGVVRLNGHPITYANPTDRVRRGVIHLSGGRAVFAPLTVRDNLRVAAFPCEPGQVDARVEEVLDLFPELRERLDVRAGALSGGQQQMLALAKALVPDPEVLLIDELSLGLAPVVVQHLLEIIATLKARGVTMVIVEQSVNLGLAIVDRAVFMERGEIRFEGSADELLDREDLLRAVFFGEEGG